MTSKRRNTFTVLLKIHFLPLALYFLKRRCARKNNPDRKRGMNMMNKNKVNEVRFANINIYATDVTLERKLVSTPSLKHIVEAKKSAHVRIFLLLARKLISKLPLLLLPQA
jgi:hypothetical protein